MPRLDLEGIVVEPLCQDELMSLHTSYRIGGPADLYAVASDSRELIELVSMARERGLPCLVIGRGTNVLVADAGIRGLVIKNGSQEIRFEGVGGPEAVLWAESGVLLRDLAQASVQRGLGGLEWAVGIPGSVGGAIVGNAGAYGSYAGDVVRRVTVLALDGTVRHLSSVEVGFGYRTSRFKGQAGTGEQEVILSAEFALHPEPAQSLLQKVAEYTRRREASQPTEPSVGSVFRRTKQYPAGFLVEQAGLKGTCIGGAQISPKHANFIVNLNGARAVDVKALIDLAKEQVKEQFGVDLEPEIEFIGEWDV